MENPRARPMTAFQERVGRVALQWMTGANTVVYRLSNGRVAGHVPGGASICLLTTRGRRTARARTVPLLYIARGDDEIVVVASHGGMSRHPAWYLNLRDDPRAKVDVGSTRRDMTARHATADERAEIWPALTAVYPHFDTYQQRTARRIPMLILSPVDPPDRRRTHLGR